MSGVLYSKIDFMLAILTFDITGVIYRAAIKLITTTLIKYSLPNYTGNNAEKFKLKLNTHAKSSVCIRAYPFFRHMNYYNDCAHGST